MNQLFLARNILRQHSFQKFAQHLQKSKSNLTSFDYMNLLQQSFDKHKKSFFDYLRLFHKYFHDIIFSSIQDNKSRHTVLQQILTYRKVWQLQELIKLDNRIIKDFSVSSIMCAIQNAYKYKQQRNGEEIIQILIDKKPDIVIKDDRDNPLIQAIRKELYDICALLIKQECYLLPKMNYSTNELHYLFRNRYSKRNQAKVLDIARLLINRKVDLYQRNPDGKIPLDFCHNQLKEEVEKMYKNYQPQKNYHSHSNSGGHKPYDNKDRKRNQDKNDNYNKNQKNRNNKGQKEDRGQKLGKSGYDDTEGSNSAKNIYKGKVKSEFGGKEIIKENNQLVRINIQSTNISLKDSSPSIPQSNVVKILNYEQLQTQANIIFQKHTLRKQDSYASQRAQYQKEQKVIKDQRSKIIQSQELKYYLKEQIKILTQKIKRQNQEAKITYQKLVADIKSRLQYQIPQISVELFGSFATDLNLQSSDIDLVIIYKQQGNKKQLTLHQIHQIFKKANYKLSQMTQIHQTKFLDKASVPIIKATCTKQYDFKQIDFSFQDEQHNGLNSVILIKKYLQIYPQLNNLMLVLKKFIYESKLFAPYSGGLSSYGLFLMIVAFIQNQETKYQSDGMGKYDVDLRVSELLINFLKFYGFTMDYVTQKIIVARPEEIHTRTNKKCTVYNPEWQNQFPPQPKLIITDPLYLQNNVGKPTRRIKQIKMAFELAYIAIHTNKRCRDKKNCQNYKKIKTVGVETRFKENRRPCCILERMFRCTDQFDLHLY